MTPRAAIVLIDAQAAGDAALARWAGWLGAAETARHAAFARPLRQRQFLAGRALLRAALAPLLSLAPAQVVLEQRRDQAPRLLPPPSWRGELPGFSIAHSGRWVACAVSAGTPVGLDIEVLDARRDVMALAWHAFDAARCAALAVMPPAQQRAAFYGAWSEQEARIKLASVCGVADGEGAAYCVAVPHGELSIALCSARVLAQAPDLQVVDETFA